MSTIHLLQNDRGVAQRIREAIHATPGLEVTGIAHTLPQARRLLAADTPDLLLADLTLSGEPLSGLLGDLRGHGRQGRPQVLVVAASADDPHLMEAMEMGAEGYFIEGRTNESLIAVIQQVLAGESPMTPDIARQIGDHFQATSWTETDFVGTTQNPFQLTELEKQILRFVAKGYLPHEIAAGMKTDAHSVGTRIRTLYRKLQYDTGAGALTLQRA